MGASSMEPTQVVDRGGGAVAALAGGRGFPNAGMFGGRPVGNSFRNFRKRFCCPSAPSEAVSTSMVSGTSCTGLAGCAGGGGGGG